MDIATGRYPEQLHQEDLLPREPHIVLALSSSSANISDYRFAVGSMNPFYFGSGTSTLTASGYICAQAGDFPQLKHKTFADGLQALIDKLVAKNQGLVVDFAPALRTAVEGHKALENCVISIPASIFNDEERGDGLVLLSNTGDYSLRSIPSVISEDFIKGFNPQTLYRLIELGVHSWRLLREFGAIFVQETYKLKDHLEQ